MFENNNLIVFVLAMLPVILYSLLVYFILPKKTISGRRARTYFAAGLLSPVVISLIHFVFPLWFTHYSNSIITMLLIHNFIQVAFFEEYAKYLTFYWVSSHRKNKKSDLPIATVYYSIMSASGFAIMENIYYLMEYGNKVLFERGLTAIVLHMICGLIMGFFMFKSKRFDNVSDRRNIYKFKKWLFIVIAIVSASLLHGIYDFNLSLLDNRYCNIIMIVILVSGIIIGYFMLKNAIKHSKIIQKNISSVINGLIYKKKGV